MTRERPGHKTAHVRHRAKQYAALPWRRIRGKIKILLVTTRNTRRWVIPKGWPMRGCTPSECAALEAFEEAGVQGKTKPTPLGVYSYRKLRKSGRIVTCKVSVFAMKVTRQKARWPEKSARDLQWCTPNEALELVNEIGLKRLIRKFSRKVR
jgi:8-oxo-dGTP pyrophosphatase MutT (NUDIX family)